MSEITVLLGFVAISFLGLWLHEIGVRKAAEHECDMWHEKAMYWLQRATKGSGE